MADNKMEDQNRVREPEDLLEIVQRIRSVSRVRPSRAFKARMTLYTCVPSLGDYLVRRRVSSERRGLGPEDGKRPAVLLSLARISTAVALIIIVAFGVFGALTIAAANSQPGDALYSIKRFREDLELTFTWDKSGKANKNLTLAQVRLEELDKLITSKKLDPANLLAVASDYSARRGTVEEVLQRDGVGINSQELASRLKVIKTIEANLEKRLAAASPTASLSPASGAMVTIRDSSGRPILVPGRSFFKARADGSGQLSVSADPGGKDGATNLEAYIELDGRAEVLPVFPASLESSSGRLSGAVTPGIRVVELGQPQLFTLTLTSGDGTSVSGRSVRLVDRTGTSSINDVAGGLTLVTDSAGSCAFSLTKTSLEHVSRVTATVIDGSPLELGEVLTVGGLRSTAGGTRRGDVSVTSSGPPAGPQNIELNNGLVRVTASGSHPGYVVDSLTGVSLPGSAGPLYDPLVGGESRTPADGLKMTGPRLTFANADAAGYQLDLETPSGLRKSYEVLLDRGSAYVVVRCTIEAPTGSGALSDDAGASLEVSRLEVAQGGTLYVSDNRMTPNTSGNTTALYFQVGRPYAVVADGSQAILACPVDTETYPDGWNLGPTYIAPYLQRRSLGAGSTASMTLLLGTGDTPTIDSFKKQSLEGIGRLTPAREAGRMSSDGFLIETSPSIGGLRKGKQTITLSIYKQYEKVLER